MKFSLTTLSFLILSLSGYALTPPDSTSSVLEKGTAQFFISEGKQYYNEGKFKLAILKFREALLKDTENPVATYWLAECHLFLGDYEKAKDFCEKAIALSPDVHNQSAYLLGVAYHRLGNLDKAIENYRMATTMLGANLSKELWVEFRIDECERAKTMIKAPVSVKILNIGDPIVSSLDEYAAFLSPDRKILYFVSRRSDNRGGGINPDDDRYFEDIYMSVWDEQKKIWGAPSNNDPGVLRLNSKGFDAISCISVDGTEIYITVNTTALEGAERKPVTRSSDLFVAKLNTKGEWNAPKPVSKLVNGINFDGSATVTADGKIMYFVSERVGGLGMGDIYITYKSGKEWQKPESLGEVVNTKGKESTVYVTPDGEYLFFSSNGQKGMGGQDIYVTKKVDGQWIEPVNLGFPINTVSDETHFVYYPDLKKAYYATFSSASNKGAGARDIFEVDMSEYQLP